MKQGKRGNQFLTWYQSLQTLKIDFFFTIFDCRSTFYCFAFLPNFYMSSTLFLLRFILLLIGDETKIDLSSTYYLGAGDQPGNLIIHVIFKGDNYIAWSRAITLSLKSRRKFGFIDGTIVKLLGLVHYLVFMFGLLYSLGPNMFILGCI